MEGARLFVHELLSFPNPYSANHNIAYNKDGANCMVSADCELD